MSAITLTALDAIAKINAKQITAPSFNFYSEAEGKTVYVHPFAVLTDAKGTKVRLPAALSFNLSRVVDVLTIDARARGGISVLQDASLIADAVNQFPDGLTVSMCFPAKDTNRDGDLLPPYIKVKIEDVKKGIASLVSAYKALISEGVNPSFTFDAEAIPSYGAKPVKAGEVAKGKGGVSKVDLATSLASAFKVEAKAAKK